MRSGSIYDVADVLKSLTLLSKSKNLSFREKRMLDRARFLVVSEISEVLAGRPGRHRDARRPRARPLASPRKSRVSRRARKAAKAARRCAAVARRAAPPRGARRRRRRSRVSYRRREAWIARRSRPFVYHATDGLFRRRPRRRGPRRIVACRRFAVSRWSSPPSARSPPTSPSRSTSCWSARLACSSRWLFKWPGLLYVLVARRRRPRRSRCPGSRRAWPAREHLPRDRAAVYCANHTSNIDAPLLFHVLHPRLHMLYKAEFAQDADPRPRRRRSPASSPWSGRTASSRSGRRPGRRVASRAGNSFLVFPGRHAKPHRRAAAVQEGRLHHGHQGAGADRARGHHRGPGGHEEGQPADPAGDGRRARRASRSRPRA